MRQNDVHIRISAVGHYSVHRDRSMASCHSAVAVAPITTCVVHHSQNRPHKVTRFPMNPKAGSSKVEITVIKAYPLSLEVRHSYKTDNGKEELGVGIGRAELRSIPTPI